MHFWVWMASETVSMLRNRSWFRVLRRLGMGRITNDLFDVTEFAHHCPEEFFIAAIKIIVSFIILCQASVPLTLIVFACVPLMMVVLIKLNLNFREATRKQRWQIGELNASIEDSLLGERVVKAFAAEEQEEKKFEEGNQKFKEIKTERYYSMASSISSSSLRPVGAKPAFK